MDPARVVGEIVVAPVADAERRVAHHRVDPLVGEGVRPEAVTGMDLPVRGRDLGTDPRQRCLVLGEFLPENARGSCAYRRGQQPAAATGRVQGPFDTVWQGDQEIGQPTRGRVRPGRRGFDQMLSEDRQRCLPATGVEAAQHRTDHRVRHRGQITVVVAQRRGQLRPTGLLGQIGERARPSRRQAHQRRHERQQLPGHGPSVGSPTQREVQLRLRRRLRKLPALGQPLANRFESVGRARVRTTRRAREVRVAAAPVAHRGARDPRQPRDLGSGHLRGQVGHHGVLWSAISGVRRLYPRTQQ